jgi:hypothetical protein
MQFQLHMLVHVVKRDLTISILFFLGFSNPKTTSASLFVNHYSEDTASFNTPMNDDCAEVDELILRLADYKNDYADMAAEMLLRKCSISWEAYRYLQDRAHDAWLPDNTRQQVRRVIKRIQVQIHQQREYSWVYEQL